MPQVEIWSASGDESPAKLSLDRPSVLSSQGLTPLDLTDTMVEPWPPVRVSLVPCASPGTLCVLLVPSGLSPPPRRNGSPLGAGLHRLQHADCVEFAGYSVWVSGQRDPEVIEYDPEVHGETVYCFRSKARLEKDERVVICPGLPSQPERCGRLFREAAWTSGARCHQCGFDASLPRWQPPSRSTHRMLQRILAMAGGS